MSETNETIKLILEPATFSVYKISKKKLETDKCCNYSFKTIRHMFDGNHLDKMANLILEGRHYEANILALSTIKDKLRKEWKKHSDVNHPEWRCRYSTTYMANFSLPTIHQVVLDINNDIFKNRKNKIMPEAFEDITQYIHTVASRRESIQLKGLRSGLRCIRHYQEDVLHTVCTSPTDWKHDSISCEGWRLEAVFPSDYMGFILLQSYRLYNEDRLCLRAVYRGRLTSRIGLGLPRGRQYTHCVNDYGLPIFGYDPKENAVWWAKTTFDEYLNETMEFQREAWVKLNPGRAKKPSGKFSDGFVRTDRTGIYHAMRTSRSLEVIKCHKHTSILPRVLFNEPIKDYHITSDNTIFVVCLNNSRIEYSPLPQLYAGEIEGLINGFVHGGGDLTKAVVKWWLVAAWPKKMAKNMIWKVLDMGFEMVHEIASAGYPMHAVIFRSAEDLKVFQTDKLVELQPGDDFTRTPNEWVRHRRALNSGETAGWRHNFWEDET
ncbi:hypothetical protein TWF481_010310 [Arthrobotrys musiformis]|uniref:Uncharacterized protein n=1 Tax=Arthrobotrys musiformis TaxID=47236 RepID=A0AAV9W1T3_9PEZI